MSKTAVIGGGAAGFFLAINLKEQCPEMEVDLFERANQVLAKVAVSGGGRCNCTNTFEGVTDLKTVYPRGHRLMKRLFNVFDYRDAFAWFERHGVPLTIQDDHCVFPAAQDSKAIIDCMMRLTHQYGIRVHLHHPIRSMEEVSDYDFVAVTTGGSLRGSNLSWLQDLGHPIVEPVPSLFSLSIADTSLKQLMGTVVENTIVQIEGAKWHASGPLLVTHWGLSGPAILKLSSHAARYLYDCHYKTILHVNWTGLRENDVREVLAGAAVLHRQKLLVNHCPVGLPQRLWHYLVGKTLGEKTLGEQTNLRWADIGKKGLNQLTNTLVNDTINISGRAPFRDEFVTCGGVALQGVQPTTMESRLRPGLFFAGEVLDIDGVTGGFNFQAAWSTAYVAVLGILSKKMGHLGG